MKKDSFKTTMNRRQFIQSAVGAGLIIPPVAGLILTPMITKAAETAAKGDEINVAIIGVGDQGRILLESCVKIPGLRFKALCDIWTNWNQQNQAKFLKAYKHEVNTYVDYKEMLDKEKDLQAVIIASPDFWHAEHTIACLKAGLHVYCEKEMSNTVEGAKKMVQAAKETGKLLQIGHQRRSNPRYIFCKDKLMKEGILGKITTINGQWNRSVQPPRGFPKGKEIDEATLTKYGFKSMEQFRDWRWYKGLGGGPIVDIGSHQIDIYNWFLDAMPKAVMANGGTDYYDKKDHEWYDTVMALYTYDAPKGTVRAFYQTITTNCCQGYFETFMGDEGTLLISEASGRGSVYREKRAPEWDKWVKQGLLSAAKTEKKDESSGSGAVLDSRQSEPPEEFKIPIDFNDPYHKPHLENFFNAVRGKEKLNCPGDDAYQTAVTVLKVNEAVEAAKKLEFKPEEFKI